VSTWTTAAAATKFLHENVEVLIEVIKTQIKMWENPWKCENNCNKTKNPSVIQREEKNCSIFPEINDDEKGALVKIYVGVFLFTKWKQQMWKFLSGKKRQKWWALGRRLRWWPQAKSKKSNKVSRDSSRDRWDLEVQAKIVNDLKEVKKPDPQTGKDLDLSKVEIVINDDEGAPQEGAHRSLQKRTTPMTFKGEKCKRRRIFQKFCLLQQMNIFDVKIEPKVKIIEDEIEDDIDNLTGCQIRNSEDQKMGDYDGKSMQQLQ
jgi:hypothetical protein